MLNIVKSLIDKTPRKLIDASESEFTIALMKFSTTMLGIVWLYHILFR